MRVLCATTAAEGHFGPLKAVGVACLRAGHEVMVAAPASFAGAVGRAGLEHLPFADVPAEVMGPLFASLPGRTFEDANDTVMREIFGRLDAQHALPGVQAAVSQWRPDVILREPAEFASLAVAEAIGLPHVEVAIGVAEVMSAAREQLAAPLAELEALAGVPAGRLATAIATSPVFTMVPASIDDAADGPDHAGASLRPVQRYRADPLEGSEKLPEAWGDPGDPLVYVTFGTVTAGLGQLADVFGMAVQALADLPVRVLLTTGYAGGFELPEPWPPNVHVEKFWPQDEVMRSAAAMVGHGGFGTTMSALAAGVPQVVAPLFTYDQSLNAKRVAAVGAGVLLEGGPGAIPGLAAALTRVLADPGIALSARRVASEIASLPRLDDVVPAIEQVAGQLS